MNDLDTEVNEQIEKRPINRAPSSPSELQDMASDPQVSAWVGASAGTGKTKVLTDRVLRLLLPRRDNATMANSGGNSDVNLGSDPGRILCLTFTKAAAAEMAVRINQRLADWTVADDDQLNKELQELTGMRPDADLRAAARRLFGQVIDAPGGLKIMTIHAFCQSMLSRFPLEADISPNFEIIDDTLARQLMDQAIEDTLSDALEQDHPSKDSKETIMRHAFDHLSRFCSETKILSLIQKLEAERLQFLQMLREVPGRRNPSDLWVELCSIYDLDPARHFYSGQSTDIYRAFCQLQIISQDRLWRVCQALSHGGVKDKAAGEKLQRWLEGTEQFRLDAWDILSQSFMTKKKEPRKLSKAAVEQTPTLEQDCEQISAEILKVEERAKTFQAAQDNWALLLFGQAVQENYAAAKARRNVLDFEDMIRLSGDLLSKTHAAQWVLFKLDGGLDHILIDEAQDTNPQQWEIIAALSQDFFGGDTAQMQDPRTQRTIFVVGDDKQSIFSFQRADPDGFVSMRRFFKHKIEQARQKFRPVALNTSFRSTPPILRMVNAIFNKPDGRLSLGLNSQEDITHFSDKEGHAGQVELWPLIDPAEKEAKDAKEEKETQKNTSEDPGWLLPILTSFIPTPKAELSKTIAGNIKQMLDQKEILPSKGRTVEPGDIMILLRERHGLAASLIRDLKSLGIPVSGLDRMVLTQELVVEDMLSLADFALLPEDDLSLACILRSPLIDLSEDNLYDLAYGRPGSLWAALKSHPDHKAIAEYLSHLIKKAGELRPYDFFASILHATCPAALKIQDQNKNATPYISGFKAIQYRLGQDAIDPLEEFLNSALGYEQEELPSLQSFVYRQRHNHSQIKRDQEEAGGKVRIMTVHGSKGLQAPIVFLPDTIMTARSQARKRPDLIWPNRSGLSLPIWRGRPVAEQSEIFAKALAPVEDYLGKEYQRLLYVAVTRAEDRLIICGAQPSGADTPLPNCWYEVCRRAFDGFDDVQTHMIDGIGDVRRISTSQTAPLKIDQKNKQEHKPKSEVEPETPPIKELPDWVYCQAKTEPIPPRPLTPLAAPLEPDGPKESEGENEGENDGAKAKEPGMVSPLLAQNRELSPKTSAPHNRFRRGVITHKLLEYLPDIAPERQEMAAKNYLAQAGSGLPDMILEEITRETLAILNDPQFAPIFGPGSMAEVPVSGLIPSSAGKNSQIINGRIDRLLITPEEILIIDYKTNRPSPHHIKDVPQAYMDQLRGYHDILRQIYPDRPIRCALLWTDGPHLLSLDEF